MRPSGRDVIAAVRSFCPLSAEGAQLMLQPRAIRLTRYPGIRGLPRIGGGLRRNRRSTRSRSSSSVSIRRALAVEVHHGRHLPLPPHLNSLLCRHRIWWRLPRQQLKLLTRLASRTSFWYVSEAFRMPAAAAASTALLPQMTARASTVLFGRGPGQGLSEVWTDGRGSAPQSSSNQSSSPHGSRMQTCERACWSLTCAGATGSGGTYLRA
mmetsp:Transcript_62242/g.133848  ORF Transcript_62242/g.133848 Transcript_62242/m.133848 type:complete len:210 (-) Transcript_62242:535-1164(-)